MPVKKSRKSSSQKPLPRRQRCPPKPRQPKPHAFPASHYQKAKEDFNKIGRVKKNHCPATKNNTNEISGRWVHYCQNIDKDDPKQHIKDATYDDVVLFLRWNLDNYRSRKRSNIIQKFKHWRQLYRKWAQKGFDVNVDINGPLTEEYHLDITTKEKPVANVDDVYTLLHHHWSSSTSAFPDLRQLLQLALILLFCAYTATRPGALVCVERNNKVPSKDAIETFEEKIRGDDDDDDDEGDESDEKDKDDATDYGKPLDPEEILQCLCYKHTKLVLLPNPEGERDIHRQNAKRKIFSAFDDLLFDPVMLVITLGLIDAFDVEYTSVQQMFQLRVDPHWNDDWKEKPIFRQAVPTSDGVRTSDDEPLKYHTMLYYLQRLGFMLGLVVILNPYNIRRGAGEGVQDVATQGQLQQVMAIEMPASSRLRRPSQSIIFRSLGHMSRNMDSRAPTRLTTAHIEELKQRPLIVRLRERKDALYTAVKVQHKTLKEAEEMGSETLRLYREAAQDLESAKKKEKRDKLDATRKEFFKPIETQDARRQLGFAPTDLKEGELQLKEEELSPERKRVAELLCQNISGLDEKEKLQHRVKTIAAMWEMCRTPGAPAKRKPQSHHRNWGIVPSPKAGSISPLMWTPMMAGTPPLPPPYPYPMPQAVPMSYAVPSPHDVPIPQAFAMPAFPMPHAVPIPQVSVKCEPTLIMNKQCLWWVCRKGERREFCRKGKAEEHLDKQHLSWFSPGAAISCPDEYCQYTLIWGSDHLK